MKPKQLGGDRRLWQGWSRPWCALGMFCVAGTVLPCAVEAGTLDATGSKETDFTQLSLEELGSVKVTSVSKRSEDLSSVAAAVTVITQDELRRSGITTIPEALRLAPGVQVGRVNGHEWAVSVRGFNDVYAQKLLVLMDGRTLYSPLFSGTLWMTQDTLMEDVDRIEVIRGPGGTVWGANAVNGVVNVVTKSAKETQGVLLTGGVGSSQLGAAAVRYGGKVNDALHYRVYGKYDQWDEFDVDGGSVGANDGWWKGQGGLRLDWDPTDSSRFTLQAEGFSVDADHGYPFVEVTPPYNSTQQTHWRQHGVYVLGRWTRTFSEESELSVQTFFDRQVLTTPLMSGWNNIFDLDVQQRVQWGDRHTFVVGGGMRYTQLSLDGTRQIQINEKFNSHDVENFFAQDEITLIAERLHLTLGSKFEHNDFTGWEVQPGARLSWTPAERHTLWGSVARAVRTPSEIERSGTIVVGTIPPQPPFVPLPTQFAVQGNTGFESEQLMAYELGYRVKVSSKVTLDAAGFANQYNGSRGTVSRVDVSGLPNYTSLINDIMNNVDGWTYGTELSGAYQATSWWLLRAQFSFLNSDLEAPNNAVTGAPVTPSLSSPQFQIGLRSSMELAKHFELDGWLRFVDEIDSAGITIPGVSTGSSSIPSYLTADLRVAWHPKPNLEVSITGQNLFDPVHREFNPTYTSTRYTEVPRSVFAKVSVRF